MKSPFIIKVIFRVSIITLIVLVGVSCSDKPIQATGYQRLAADSSFSAYWYNGTAEVSSYKLSQARYGEIREGQAVLIFVTEPFSKSKQIKLDDPSKKSSDEQTVMKLNFVKKFQTGIYPYSLMLSAFTPVETSQYPNSVKVTMTGQEWCGHVFAQMNALESGFAVQSFSYFESEGDIKAVLDKNILEDEIWNRIRLNYNALPVDTFTIIPGFFHTRLLHQSQSPQFAVGKISINGDLGTYELSYLENSRKLSISFETNFPYKILSWQESTIDRNGKEQITTGELDTTLNIDYWRRNNNSDSYLMDSLQVK
jgi:hypothetical protein